MNLDWTKPLQFHENWKVYPCRWLGKMKRKTYPDHNYIIALEINDEEQIWYVNVNGLSALGPAGIYVENVPEKPKEYIMLKRTSDSFIVSVIDASLPDSKWWRNVGSGYTEIRAREVKE